MEREEEEEEEKVFVCSMAYSTLMDSSSNPDHDQVGARQGQALNTCPIIFIYGC